jgi:hypothetical protein
VAGHGLDGTQGPDSWLGKNIFALVSRLIQLLIQISISRELENIGHHD